MNIQKEKNDRIKTLETALKVIHTWASCDGQSPNSRQKAMGDIMEMAKEGLYGKDVKR